MALPTAEELEAEMAALDNKRRATAALLSALRDYEAANASGLPVSVSVQQDSRGRRYAPIMEVTESVASELMEKKNAPVATADVVAEMRQRGIEVPEKNANNVISARLSNSAKFIGRRGRGYWFANRAWPSETFDDILGGPTDDNMSPGNEIGA